jgi:hypothetical protein
VQRLIVIMCISTSSLKVLFHNFKRPKKVYRIDYSSATSPVRTTGKQGQGLFFLADQWVVHIWRSSYDVVFVMPYFAALVSSVRVARCRYAFGERHS